VPEGRIINAMVELVPGYSFVEQTAAHRGATIVDRPAKFHEVLEAFAKKRSLRAVKSTLKRRGTTLRRLTSAKECSSVDMLCIRKAMAYGS